MNKHPYIIAEIGQAHDGSLGIAHSYIDALAQCGVNAVKFQIHIAEAESSAFEPFRINFTKQDKSRFDYWKRVSFTLEQWRELKLHCTDAGVEFVASPFSNTAVDLLEDIGLERYKIGSGEVNNFLLLERISKTGKPLIISSGLSSYSDLDLTVEFLRSRQVEFSLLQCTTAYPTKPVNYGLNVIMELRKRYGVPVGFSDHSGRPETIIAATALGAEIIEFHAVYSRQSFGPDSASSLEISEIKNVVESVLNISTAISNPIEKKRTQQFEELKNIFEKSLSVNKDLPAGHIIKFEDLEGKKPKGYGISASEFQNVIGKKLKNRLHTWDFLNYENLE